MMNGDVDLKNILKNVKDAMTQNSKNVEELGETIEDLKEMQDEYKEANEMVNELIMPDEEDQEAVEDLYAEFENDLAEDELDEMDN